MKAKGIKTLLASLVAIITSVTMLLGTTFAWFSDSSSSGVNIIQSGNLDVGFVYSNSYNGTPEEVNEETKIFMDINGEPILWEPGAFASGRFEVSNKGSLALKYQLKIISANETQTPTGKTLADALTIYALARNKNTGADEVMEDKKLEDLQIDSAVPEYDPQNMPSFKDGFCIEAYLLPQESITYEIGVFWEPSENDNEFNISGGLSIDFAVALIATQVSYENDGDGFYYDLSADYPSLPKIPDRWDGNASVEWYTNNPNEETFTLSSAEDLFGLSVLVDGDSTNPVAKDLNDLPVSFAGKTIKLESDVDLYKLDENGELVSFNPIGDKSAFEGTFDGQGHTISNLYQSGWAFGYEWGSYGSLGLFGEVKNATIKNVNISGMESQVEGGDVSFIAGSGTGKCLFENITIEDSVIGTYNNGCGGIIGWSGEGEYTFKNITLKEDVVLGGLWGSFDSSIGGIVGQAEVGATYNFENVDIACRIDAYNDVTASYDYYNYRMCGMIIGRCEANTTIDGDNYPDISKYNLNFSNVIVTYNEWANYHYCRAEGARGIRVEAGYAYGGISQDYDHSVCTVHHMELMPFDQLIGGDQYGVKGLEKIDNDGVTVIYNNK